MSTEPIKRRLAAVLAADMVGYSRLMEADEEGTITRQNAIFNDLIEPAVSRHAGRTFHIAGDAFFVEFPSAVSAVRCAVEIQRASFEQAQNYSKGDQIQYRVGVNLGDVVIDGENILGDGVNVAARLEQMADPGTVYISGEVARQIEGRLDLAMQDMGERTVKNIVRPVRVFRIDEGLGDVGPAASEPQKKEGAAAAETPMVAVLPFDNLGEDDKHARIGDGIAEDIITELAKTHWLSVVARNSSFIYKGQAVDVKRIGRELGVQYVLEGSVRAIGLRLRVTAQLVDANTGRHTWAGRYDRNIDELDILQDEITTNVAAAVAPEIWAAETQRSQHKDEEELDSWDLLMRGLWHLTQFTRGDNKTARKLLNKAKKQHPSNAMILGQIAMTYMYEALYGWARDPDKAMEHALTTARSATALDNGDAIVHSVYGTVLLHAKRHEDAINVLERAVELDSNFSATHGALGSALAYAGRTEEAEAEANMALQLSKRDPFKPVWLDSLTVTAFIESRYEQAIRIARNILRDNPKWAGALRMVAVCSALIGRDEEARQAIGQLLRLTPGATVDRVTRYAAPFANKADRERYSEGLRKAGLPAQREEDA